MMMARERTVESHGWWKSVCGTSTPADARNNRRLLVASIVWVACFLAALMVMERYGDDSLAVSVAAFAVAAVAWIPVVRAYLRFLRETDELTRLIQMQAMATAFGLGLLAVLLGRFIERIAGLLPDPLIGPLQLVDILNPAMVMTVGFVATTVVLHRWYSR